MPLGLSLIKIHATKRLRHSYVLNRGEKFFWVCVPKPAKIKDNFFRVSSKICVNILKVKSLKETTKP